MIYLRQHITAPIAENKFCSVSHYDEILLKFSRYNKMFFFKKV